MGERISTLLQFTTIGEIIKKYRENRSLTISKLADLSGVSKGAISKIERGETERPEFNTITRIAKILEMPMGELIEHYVEIDKRPEVLFELINEAIQLSSISLVTKVALRFLQTPYEESHILMERLYDLVGSLTDKSFHMPLYDVIIKYARERGIQRFLAKGLMQKFLIEMLDLKRLEESFQIGEEVLHYVDFLDREERIHFYYQMAFQAHDMKKYEKCIEFGKMGHAEDPTVNEIKERVALAICNSYYRMDNITVLDEHLRMYEKLGYRFVIDRLKYYRAIILSKNGQYDKAIPLLYECVEEATKINRLHRVNILLETLIKINDADAIQQILEREEKNFAFDFTSPYNFSELGRYFRQKATFQVTQGAFDDGIEAYLQSTKFFAKINAWKDIVELYTTLIFYLAKKEFPFFQNGISIP